MLLVAAVVDVMYRRSIREGIAADCIEDYRTARLAKAEAAFINIIDDSKILCKNRGGVLSSNKTIAV